MSRYAFVNGRYLPLGAARVHVEDRGYQFSDGIYEVCLVLGGRMLDLGPHLDRMERSLAELAIAMPMSRAALVGHMERLIARNRLREGTLYLQITRGVARREHGFPQPAPEPAVVMTTRRFDVAALCSRQQRGVRVVTAPDLRWKRCDIKSVSLLGNVLAKEFARAARAFEAWMVDEAGLVTEGSSSTAWIVDHEGRLVTRRLGADILPGITRAVVFDLAREGGLGPVERAFPVAEAKTAREAFIASTSAGVTPVVAIDDAAVGDGKPGPVTLALVERHWQHVERLTGYRPSRSSSAASPAR